MAQIQRNTLSYIAELERRIQIEESLEQVRATTMAMKHSNELSLVSTTVFNELNSLGIAPHRCGFVILDKEELNNERRLGKIWTTIKNEKGFVSQVPGFLNLYSHPLLRQIVKAWEAEDIDFNFFLDEAGLLSYYEAIAPSINFPDEILQEILNSGGEHTYISFFRYGALYSVYYERPDPEECKAIQRFASVFEQAYTRFLDLKKAEEQAREAQIEAALERVRTRAMAMRQSEDILSVTGAMFDEYRSLGLPTVRCGIGIVHDITDGEAWATTFTPEGAVVQVTGHVSFLQSPIYRTLYDVWVRQEKWYKFELAGDDLKRFLKAVYTDFEFNNFSDKFPEKQVLNYFSFPQGGLYAVSVEELSEEIARVLQRFTEVFHLTYTRYQDLKQAEEQAREAMRQASLERVRAEIAYMRTADDLQRITPLIWQELTTLGVSFFRCGIFIMDDATQTIRSFLTTPHGQHLATLTIPFDNAESTLSMVEHWRCCEVFTDQWDRRQYIDWTQAMISQGQLDLGAKIPDEEFPSESLSLHFVPFTQGMLYIGCATPLSDDKIDLVQALAGAFSVAYARYEDFHKLETKNGELATTLHHLEATQTQLIQSEKLASLGQLTAGIAHEIKNPLNFINNFSEISISMLKELSEWAEDKAGEYEKELFDLVILNAGKIKEHGQRADSIVRSMMQHARKGSGKRHVVAVNALLEEYVNLAAIGWPREGPMQRTPVIKRDYDPEAGEIEMVPQEIGQVLVNLFNNAFDAMKEKGAGEAEYTPELVVSTRRRNGHVDIRVMDNGSGIRDEIRNRIFEPFFTTKPAGEGTGLGLSLSYDIVTKGHGGQMTVNSDAGKGTAFTVSLPV